MFHSVTAHSLCCYVLVLCAWSLYRLGVQMLPSRLASIQRCRGTSSGTIWPNRSYSLTRFNVKHFFFSNRQSLPLIFTSNVWARNCVNHPVSANQIEEVSRSVWLTDRRGKAAAAWRWPAPGRGFLRWAWCLPTCPPAPCPSPSAGRSFWTAAALRRSRPARSEWTVPWRRRNLQEEGRNSASSQHFCIYKTHCT